jgi:membrane protease YdiL (CAAX protease family)
VADVLGESMPVAENPQSDAAFDESQSQTEVKPAELRPMRYGRLLWLASVVASVLVIPYTISILSQIGNKPSMESLRPQIAESLAETAILAVLMIALGLACGKSVGLVWPPLDGWGKGPDNRRRMRSAVKLAVILSVAAAGFDLVLNYVIQQWGDLDINIQPPSWWASLLGSVGAGISEEIWLRLGVMTFFVWLGAKLTRQKPPGAAVIWIGNLLACLIFGAMHLPQIALATGHLSTQLVTLALLGNGVPGLIFGWLYWRKGLIAAMVCHAITDVIIKVILPLLGF